MKKLILGLVCALLLTSAMASAQTVRLVSMRSASGDLTVNDNPAAIPSTANFSTAKLFLDITKITTADADDKICFYFQTTYNLVDWTDIESVCVGNADDGTTRKIPIVVDRTKDGPGTNKASIGTDPAVGANISETVPANQIWRLVSMQATLVTDASDTVRIQVDIDDGVFGHYASIAESTQAVSTTEVYIVGTVGSAASSIAGVHYIPMPANLFFPAGHRISTLGTTSGDNWNAPHWIMEVWHDPRSSTDGTMCDNCKSYDRPIGMELRVKAVVTGATAPTYAYSVSALLTEN